MEESEVNHNIGFLEGPWGIGVDVMVEGSGILNASMGVDGDVELPLPLPNKEFDTIE